MINVSSNKLFFIINVLLFLYIIFWFNGWIDFSINSLFKLNFFDPATENYHFYNLYNYKKIFLTENFEDLSHGNFTIYPHLLEKLTYFFLKDNFFPNARIFTAISFYFLIILIFFYCFYQTRNIIFSLIILTIFYGWNNHIIYFQMYKPDIFYLLFGFISVFFLFLSKNKLVVLFLSSLFLSLSIYSKQTGIAFIIFNFLNLFYIYFDYYEKKSFKNFIRIFLLYILFFLFFCIIIFYYLDYNSLISFLRGIEGYSNKFNPSHMFNHIKYYFIYGYFILPLTIIIFMFLEKDINFKFFLLTVLASAHLLSINMWNNVGAFSNNFIIINSLSIFLVIKIYKKTKNIKYKNIIIFIIFLNSLHFVGIAKGQFSFGYNQETKNSNLLQLIKEIEKDDKILTYNYSFINFLNNSDAEIQYDSVIPILKLDIQNNQLIRESKKQNFITISNKINSINKKILNKEYKFIIFSNPIMLDIHKDIKYFYYLDRTIITNAGNFQNIPVKIYKPKTNN